MTTLEIIMKTFETYLKETHAFDDEYKEEPEYDFFKEAKASLGKPHPQSLSADWSTYVWLLSGNLDDGVWLIDSEESGDRKEIVRRTFKDDEPQYETIFEGPGPEAIIKAKQIKK